MSLHPHSRCAKRVIVGGAIRFALAFDRAKQPVQRFGLVTTSDVGLEDGAWTARRGEFPVLTRDLVDFSNIHGGSSAPSDPLDLWPRSPALGGLAGPLPTGMTLHRNRGAAGRR